MRREKYSRLIWIALLVTTVIAISSVLIPVWSIQPFKPQTTKILAWAFILRRWSPSITIVIVIISTILSTALWRTTSRYLTRIALCLNVLIVCSVAWFAQQNYFEWMFAPIKEPSYCRNNEVNFLNDQDMVIAVTNNQEAAAYPIRQMAYHHVLSDVVGGKPIVVTY